MENNLDKYFRENLNDRKFEPNEAYWLAAEQLLDAQDKRRKRRGIFWWFFSGMMGLSLFAGLIIWNNVRSNKQVVKNATEIAVSQPNNGKNDGLNNHDSKSDIGEVRNDNDSLNDNNKKTKNKAAILENMVAKTENKKAGLNNPQSNNRSQQATDNQQLAKQRTGSYDIVKSNNLNDLNQAKSKKQDAKNTNFNPPSIEPQSTLENQLNNADATITATNESDLIRQSAPDFLAIIRILVKGNIAKQNLSTTTQKIKVATPATWQLSLFAAQFGQPIPDNDEKAFLGQRAGLLLRKNLRTDWYFATGLSYQRRVGSFDATQTAYQRNYRFGLELDTFLLRPTSLHYVSLPFIMGYERNKSRFEAGLFMDFLTGMRGETGSYQKQGEPPVKVFEADKSGWVTTVGYRRLVPTAQLGYHFQLARRWSLGLTANYTIGGILDKNHEWPVGSFRLKETEKFQLGAQLNYRIN